MQTSLLKFSSKITKCAPVRKLDNCCFEISGSYRTCVDENNPISCEKKVKEWVACYEFEHKTDERQ